MKLSIKTVFGIRKKSHPGPTGQTRRNERKSAGVLASLNAAGDRIAFSWEIRQALYRHLSAQVGNGVPVEIALDKFRSRLQRRKKASSDKIVADVTRRMRDGATLADALSKWVPQDESSVINSGELSGNLPRSMDLIIESKQLIARVTRAVKSALISPVIYSLAVYAMLWAIGRYVTPGLEQALPKDRAQGLVAGLYAAGDFANSVWAFLPVCVLAVLAVLVMRSLPRWTGRSRIAAEGVFPYSFYRDIQGYTWLMSFANLLRAGMPDVEILKRQSAQSTPWLKERLSAVWWRMDNGASLSSALMSPGKGGLPPFGFPNPDIVDDIASMAGFSDFSERISLVAIQWAEELELNMLARAKFFGIVMEIAMYAVMGLLMFAINSMSTQMGNVPGM